MAYEERGTRTPEAQIGKSVLVVEDDAIYRELLVTALRSVGYQVRSAENGVNGLSRIREARPDVILLDMLMPAMDGLAFLRELNETLKLRLPTIVLTCMDSRSVVVDALVAGAREVLTKPVCLDVLLQKVGRACRAGAEPEPQ